MYPYFTKVPRNSSVKIGSKAKLECAASGYPTTQISWQKDGGTEFPAAQEHRMKVFQDDVFLIINVKLIDMGIYSCNAKNSIGTVAANATLTILGIIHIVYNAFKLLWLYVIIIILQNLLGLEI